MDPITALGERVLSELGADQTTDTLTRWLTHRVARLVQEADLARVEDASDAESRAAAAHAAILDLWEHRSAWTSGWPPPRANAAVRLLDALPTLNDPDWVGATTTMGRLQDLHHHVLGVLVDLATPDSDGIEESWLQITGESLTPEEVSLLTYAVNAPRRLDILLGNGGGMMSRLRRQLLANRNSDEVEDGVIPNRYVEDSDHVVERDEAPPQHPLVELVNAYRETVLAIVRRAGVEVEENSAYEDGRGRPSSP